MMEKYSVLELLGEGSYGKVMKCRHNETGVLVAIKKFIETEEDTAARKVALREIRMLKKLHHPNLVCLLEVFRRKKRFHLVFEFMNCSLLDELEANGSLPEDQVRKYMYQIVRGVDYCHSHNIIHRDIKPENILISDLGIVKLCDFGFARFATISNEPFTDYVATRWYRPPELLVGDLNYGRAVDIWALGCILLEMLTGEPLFAGDSDIDQLYQITKLLGSLTERQKSLIVKYSEKHGQRELYGDDVIEQIKGRYEMDTNYCLKDKFPDLERRTLDIAAVCLRIDPDQRLTSEQLLKHSYFTWDKFLLWYLPELQKKIQLEASRKVPLTDIPCTPIESNSLGRFILPTVKCKREPVENLINFASKFRLLAERKPSRLTSGWSINFINDAAVKDNPIYKEIVEAKKQGETSVSSETTKGTEILPSQISSEVSPRFSESQYSQRFERNKYEGLEFKDLEKATKEMPKISMEYKRNMIPNTLYIRPVKGRLQYDKYLTLPCMSENIEKPPCEGIYLPMIKKGPDKRTTPDKKNPQLKRKTSASRETENVKSQKDIQEEVCSCQEDRLKVKPKSFKNCNFLDI